MDCNMSTAAYMHRSGGSTSTSSAGTGSSTGGGSGSGSGGGGIGGIGGTGTGGGRMAIIGVTKNVRLRRRGANGFGFSLRGGREYAAGFYVSDVQPGGEAHRNGLRVGDQIIRVNGYPVEDAVHQEVALLAKNQQVLVLKIRSVGMIPVKKSSYDSSSNPNDPVTWHMVQQQQQQLQYNETGTGPPSSEIRIRILVGEKGRLGCGVCRGIVPGLTVQGTREGGPARAAGLKAGDVITWCNGQRLTDLPFERAIEVMRGAAILDLIVNRPAAPNHLYDSPESLWMRGSSGYDSETSSMMAGSSPTQQIPMGSPQHRGDNRISHPQRYPREDAYNRNARTCCPLALSTSSCSSSEWTNNEMATEWTRKPNNTTVIRVNQNQYSQHHHQSHIYDETHEPGNHEPLYDPVAPRIDYEVHDFDANPRDEASRRLAHRRENGNAHLYDGCGDDHHSSYHSPKENGQHDMNRLSEMQQVHRQMENEKKTVTTVEVHQSVCPPAPPPPLPYKWPADTKPMNAMGMQMGSTMSMGSTGSTETESSLESSCSKDSVSTSSSLSNTSSCEPGSTVSFASSTAGVSNGITSKTSETTTRNSTTRNSPISNTDLSTAITQELQRRAQQRSMNANKAETTKEKNFEPKKLQNPEALRSQEQKVTHDKLMEEFKRAHRRMFSAAQQRMEGSEENNEQQQEKRVINGTHSTPTNTTAPAPAAAPAPPPPPLPLAVASSKTKNGEDAVEMQSIESFKLKDSPNTVVPKPPPTYFPLSNSTNTTTSSAMTASVTNGSPRHTVNGNKAQINNEKDTASNGTNDVVETKKLSATTTGPPIANGNQNISKPVGKVAIRIGSYEGEAKQPSRLEFLPQQTRPINNEKSNGEDRVDAPVVSRLQNELVATLQRSNLRKKTEGENAPARIEGALENSDIPEPNKLPQSTVDKLASALNNKVTIKVSPENGSR